MTEQEVLSDARRRVKRARTRSRAYEIVREIQEDLGRIGDERIEWREYEGAGNVLLSMETLARVRSEVALGHYSRGDTMTADGRDRLCRRINGIVLGTERVGGAA